MKTETEPETIICKLCDEKTPFDESRYLPNTGDVCESCYSENVQTCEICGDEDVTKDRVSDFIVCKAELSRTASRPPGIYRVAHYPFLTCSMLGGGWMHGYDVIFVDKLPKPDESYRISGHICDQCSKTYVEKFRSAFGRRSTSKFGFDKRGWELERGHTRSTILANPEMLRDLECDSTDSRWEDIRKLYDLPELPTFHEWVFVEHKGIKVFYAGYKSPDSWMTWHPEPRFRSNGHGADVFSPGSLPNAKKHFAAYVDRSARSLQHTFRNIDKPTRSLRYWRERVSHYDAERAVAKAITVEAIELGFVRQDGVFDRRGRPMNCR